MTSKQHRIRLTVLVVALFLSTMSSVTTAAKITMMTPLWNDEIKEWIEQEAIPEFQQQNPRTEVEVSYANWDGLHAKIVVAAASGVGPDVYVTTGEGSAKSDGENGLALALDKYVQGWADTKDFIPPAWPPQQSEGHTYAIPNTMNLRTYAVNNEMFSLVGLNPAAALGDWPQFLDTVKKLNQFYLPREQAGFRANLDIYFEGVMNEARAPWLGDDGLLHMDTPQATAALDHLVDLWQAGGAETGMFLPQKQSGNHFRDAKGAMAWIDIQQISVAQGRLGEGSVTLPRPVRDTAIIPVTGLAISAASNYPDDAWNWISFLSAPRNLSRFNVILGRIPPRLSTAAAKEFRTSTLLQAAADIAVRYGVPCLLSNRYGTIQNIRVGAETRLFNMLNGKVSPTQTGVDIEALWQSRVTSN